jgi:hypothetical protein
MDTTRTIEFLEALAGRHGRFTSHFPRAGLLLASMLLVAPLAASAATEGPYTYTVTDGKATITGCDSSCSGSLSIPNQLGDYPVTAIGTRPSTTAPASLIWTSLIACSLSAKPQEVTATLSSASPSVLE